MWELFNWLGRLRRTGLHPVRGLAKPVSYSSQYLAADGTQVGGPEKAAQRLEIEPATAGIVEQRWYRLDPVEWLERQTRVGTDEAGRPYSCRIHYWPWGAEAQRVESWFEGEQQCVEYRAYFPDGDLKLHKKRVGDQLTERFAYSEPRYGYRYIEKMPEYPGGMPQLLKDLGQVTKYPTQALRRGETGKVFVGFLVQPDGLLENVTVNKGVSPALDAAAVQAIEALGHKRWRPGFQNRRAVSVSYTVPITFRIA